MGKYGPKNPANSDNFDVVFTTAFIENFRSNKS